MARNIKDSDTKVYNYVYSSALSMKTFVLFLLLNMRIMGLLNRNNGLCFENSQKLHTK